MMLKPGLQRLLVVVIAGSLAFTCGCQADDSGNEAEPSSLLSLSTPNSTWGDKWTLWTEGTQLRGVNIYQRLVFPELDGNTFMGPGPLGPPYTQADFDRLASLGANYINISHTGLYTASPPYGVDQQAVDNLDGLLEMIARADMFAVITFRSGPGRSDFSLQRDGAGDWFDESLLIETAWEDPDARSAWEDMWKYTAGRYKDNPIVVGYDLMCEPNANDILDIWEPGQFYDDYGDTGHDWNTWYPDIVSAIREVDQTTPILVGGDGYSSLDWLPYLEPVASERIVYTFHLYDPYLYTHQEPGSSGELPFSYPGQFDLDYDGQIEEFDRAWLEGILDEAVAYSTRHGVPLAVNEFGLMRWEPGGEDYLRDQMTLFEEQGWNYALWDWESSWEPWSESVNDFNFLFGPDPQSNTETPNDLLDAIQEAWSRNTVRPSTHRATQGGDLAEVSKWLYLIGDSPEEELLSRIADSTYDLVVLDFIPSETGEEEYPMREVITQLHNASHPKLVVAYINIGEAESFRTYWQDDWRVGSPGWIISGDPDGWADDYPVAYWASDWQNLWLNEDGLLGRLLSFGFDGVYLDWVEAYSDGSVVAAAQDAGVDPVEEMVTWVGEISAFIHGKCPECVVIAQNAAELVERDEYVALIDAITQEQVWFDGGADNDPEGDCPLPRTEAEVDTQEYYDSLPRECQRQYDEYPDGTLHVSSESYLEHLRLARQKGLTVFTVDYALQSENVAWVYQTARSYGFIPFAGNRGLDRYFNPYP